MENSVEIEYEPKIWCEPGHEEEIKELFAVMEQALEDEAYEKKVEEAEKVLAAWKEIRDFVDALLADEGITGEVVEVEIYELVSDDEIDVSM
jgi:hypothetical protein